MLFFTIRPKKKKEEDSQAGSLRYDNDHPTQRATARVAPTNEFIGGEMKNEYLKWLLMVILRCLPVEKIIDLIVKLLKELASKTENQVDDALVDIIAEMLYSAFGMDKNQKLSELEQQFQ